VLNPLPKVYLLAAFAAFGLGAYLLGRQIMSPTPDATTGCLTTDFDSGGNSGTSGERELHLQACPHFDETTFYLWIDTRVDDTVGGGSVFSASGPSDPRAWPRYLRIRWNGPRELSVAHTRDIRFLSRVDSVQGVRVVYSELDLPSPP
jgi:hypothetical protein